METITWTTQTRKLKELIPWPDNPRRLTKEQGKRLAQSLHKFGYSQLVEIEPDNTILDGHQRDFLMKTMSEFTQDTELEVRVASRKFTPEERREYVLYKGQGAVGEWDMDMISAWDPIELTEFGGFTDAQMGGFGSEPKGEDPGAQVDRAEELRVKWQVESGQLWKLGEHRLICGDCTDRTVVERVMGGEKAQLCFTSPPYAAQRDYEIGDFDWDALMLGMSVNAINFININGAILINLGLVHKEKRVVRYWDKWLEWMDNTEWPLFDWYVWDKINGLMGDWRGRLAPAHEWIFHFANEPREANKTERTKYAENGITHYKKDKVGLRTKDGTMKGFTQAGQEVSQTKVADSVIRCQPARGGVEGHPAPFSVDFAGALIDSFTNANEIVYEPFSGSGTTIVACEGMRRFCRAVELEPKYCAVAIERWAQMTGGTPELVADIQQVTA